MAYELEEAKKLVVAAGKKLVESGLIARTWGNVSARISDTQFVITPSGRAYETLTPEEVVVVNIEDCSYEGDIKPSSEKGVHAAAYRHHPTVDFVIHTHQKAATIVSITGMEIRNVYKITGVGAVAGCYVLDGKMVRSANIRVVRDGIVVHEGVLGSLQRFKDSVKEVQAGYECGLSIEKFNDIKLGDIIEGYTMEEIPR